MRQFLSPPCPQIKQTKGRFWKYLLAMLLPLSVLLIRPVTPAAVLAFGQDIRLATVPVDPRDLFRGDYVTLAFDIEEANVSLLDNELMIDRLSAGRMTRFVYAAVEPDAGGIWRIVRIYESAPESGVYLRARAYVTGDEVRLNYGSNLNSYYVRENTGRELEDAARRGQLTADVKVWLGRAVIYNISREE